MPEAAGAEARCKKEPPRAIDCFFEDFNKAESVATFFLLQSHCSGIPASFHEPVVAHIIPIMPLKEAIHKNSYHKSG
jgi:hypothetical protein